MRLILQRTSQASIAIGGKITARIGAGLLVLAGISRDDTPADAEYLAVRIPKLRLFEDSAGKMNYNVTQVHGSLLIVPNFTLYGDCSGGLRPSFQAAAGAALAQPLFDYFVSEVRKTGVPAETGVFQAEMQVSLVNEGPVTIILQSPPTRRIAQ